MNKSPKGSSSAKRKAGGCLRFLMLLPWLYYGLYFIRRGALPAQPQLIAHRGGGGDVPENTMAAFQQAIAIGADWLELDVQMTQDGQLVVIHDETVDRTTNGTGRVRDLTWAEIQVLDAGHGEHVPTFEEVIALAKTAGVKLLPEAKLPHLYPGLEAKMAQAIVAADYGAQTVIQSFEPEALNTIKALAPDIQVCPLYGPGKLNFSGPQPGQARFICPMAEMVILNPWGIKQAHAEGKQLFVWFGMIEHPLVMRFILALGADGLIVDNPAALANILGR